MKCLLHPDLREMVDNALDIIGVGGVQVETNGKTLWVNIDGVCVLRIGQFKELLMDGIEHVIDGIPKLRPDKEEEHFYNWRIKNQNTGADGPFAHFETEQEALAFTPAPHAPDSFHPFEIWYYSKPDTKGITRPKYRWDKTSKKWKKVPFGSKKHKRTISKKLPSKKK